jgi:hypothetical protein
VLSPGFAASFSGLEIHVHPAGSTRHAIAGKAPYVAVVSNDF